jgi:ParB-like chromosome segregation protein Spo0J
VSKVATSLREFGWRQPIVVDSKDVIICGHTRLPAAKEMELQTDSALSAPSRP